MTTVRVELEGDKELLRKLRQLDSAVAGQALRTSFTSGAAIFRNSAATKAPKLTRTLSRSIHVEVLSQTKARITVMVGTDVVYARIHEFGGVITPRQARFLAFEIEGQLIFAKRVHMPARPYMRPAFDENVQRVAQEIGEVLRSQIMRAVA